MNTKAIALTIIFAALTITLIPVVMLFDLTSSLYTFPIDYLIAKIVNRNLKIGNHL